MVEALEIFLELDLVEAELCQIEQMTQGFEAGTVERHSSQDERLQRRQLPEEAKWCRISRAESSWFETADDLE